jgi:hypothetical protein
LKFLSPGSQGQGGTRHSTIVISYRKRNKNSLFQGLYIGEYPSPRGGGGDISRYHLAEKRGREKGAKCKRKRKGKEKEKIGSKE